MTPKKIKPVRAWAPISANGMMLLCDGLYRTKKEVLLYGTCAAARWLRVEIRPVAPNLPTKAAGVPKGPRQPKVAGKRKRKAKK